MAQQKGPTQAGIVGDMSNAIKQLQPETIGLLRRHNLLMPLLQGLVAEEATEEVVIEPAEHDQLLQAWYGQQSREEALEVVRRRLGWDEAAVDWQVQRPEKLKRLAKQQFTHKAEARFLKRKGQLDQVVYSLVRLKEPALARELYLQLSAGEASFAELAEKYSDGPERLTKGVVGPKPIAAAHPQLAERLRTGRDGEVIPPFELAGWWLIVRRDQFEPAVFNEAVEAQMAQELLQEWVQEEAERRLTADLDYIS